MQSKNSYPKKTVVLGTYTEKQAVLLTAELEKNYIPVLFFTPASNASEHAGQEAWLARALMVPESKLEESLKICKKLKLPTDVKKPISKLGRIVNLIFFLLIIIGTFIAIYYFWRKK